MPEEDTKASARRLHARYLQRMWRVFGPTELRRPRRVPAKTRFAPKRDPSTVGVAAKSTGQQASTRSVVGVGARAQDAGQSGFIHDDHVIEALTTDGADETLCVRVLPR